jgi:WD40 repeat protein
MLRNSRSDDYVPASCDVAMSTSCPGHPVRLSIVSLLQMGLLCALIMTFLVLAGELGPSDESSPTWSFATGHPSGPRTAAFSPDGRRLATGGNDGCIVLWGVGKGLEKELSHHGQSRVKCVAFAPDGTTVASAHDDFTVVVWDITTGVERATLTGHTDGVMCLDFSPDGASLATGGGDGSIRLWDVASARTKATLCGYGRAVSSVRFSPDGLTLASGYATGVVKFWDVSAGKCRQSLDADIRRYPIHSLAFSPDGLTLASAGAGDNVKLWDVGTGLERASLRTTEGGSIRNVVFSARGEKLIAANFNGDVHLTGLAARSERIICTGNFSTYCSAFSPDGLSLALGDINGIMRIWDLNRVMK